MKTARFKDPKYVGDPVNAVKIFNEKETDELIAVDIDATATGAEPNYRLIAQLAVECRMPLCYGGGIKTVEQARHVIGLGVEKVAISSAAFDNPSLITEMAREIGGQSVVVVMDVRKNARGAYEIWTHNATRARKVDPFAWAAHAESLGAGEIVVNSIDNDGMMTGYDLTLAATVRAATRLPMTVLGGAGSLSDVAALVQTCGVVGAAAGSLFVFKGPRRAVLINYPTQAQREEITRMAWNTQTTEPPPLQESAR